MLPAFDYLQSKAGGTVGGLLMSVYLIFCQMILHNSVYAKYLQSGFLHTSMQCYMLCHHWLSLQPYFVAETTMPGKTGFDFNSASQSFNVLAEYLFGKVVIYFRTELHLRCISKFTGLLLVTTPLCFPLILREVRSYRHALLFWW